MMIPLVNAQIARLVTSALWRVRFSVNHALVTRPLWKRDPKPALVIMFFLYSLRILWKGGHQLLSRKIRSHFSVYGP